MATATVEHTYRESELREYVAWLRPEIARIEAGGAWPPWMTKEQELTRLRGELEWCESILRRGQ